MWPGGVSVFRSFAARYSSEAALCGNTRNICHKQRPSRYDWKTVESDVKHHSLTHSCRIQSTFPKPSNRSVVRFVCWFGPIWNWLPSVYYIGSWWKMWLEHRAKYHMPPTTAYSFGNMSVTYRMSTVPQVRRFSLLVKLSSLENKISYLEF